MSTSVATINGSEIVTKGNYHTLATRVLTNSAFVVDYDTITIGTANSTVTINGNVTLPEGVGMTVKIVPGVPAPENAKTGVIYMVKSDKETESDVYDEYMKINTAAEGETPVYTMEKIGSTALTVDTTFDPTSGNPQSGIALSFLDKTTLTLLQSDAYVQEAAGASTGSGAESYIDSRIQAALQNGRVLDEQELTSMTPTNSLKEGSILSGTVTGPLDLTGISLTRLATAEIWLDIPSTLSTAPQITWPISAAGTTVWLETTAPTTLSTGYRYGITIRNDGPTTGAHYLMNIAYQYALTNLS